MRLVFSALFILIVITTSGQTIAKADLVRLKKQEDSLSVYGSKMINERMAVQRFLADSAFIRILVRALKTPNSFYYPFDSLGTVSHIYAPDSSFRIFSWQFTRDEDYCRQRGAIQMRTADGSLKLFPLLDMSDFTTAPGDSIRSAQNWIGCIYYGMVMKEFNGRKFYTLFGYDDNNMRSTKKWIEVLYFDNNGIPQFGGPFFAVPSGDLQPNKSKVARFCLEYKKEAKARLNYDKELDLIMFDHLISEDNHPEKAYTYVPDGDYQGFRWANGKWVLVDKVFNQQLRDGQAPVPMPLKDAEGKNDEMRLMQQSEKTRRNNIKQQSAPPPAPKKQPARRQSDNNQSTQNQESF